MKCTELYSTSLNISEIYGSIILPKELDRELSKIYLQKELWRD